MAILILENSTLPFIKEAVLSEIISVNCELEFDPVKTFTFKVFIEFCFEMAVHELTTLLLKNLNKDRNNKLIKLMAYEYTYREKKRAEIQTNLINIFIFLPSSPPNEIAGIKLGTSYSSKRSSYFTISSLSLAVTNLTSSSSSLLFSISDYFRT